MGQPYSVFRSTPDAITGATSEGVAVAATNYSTVWSTPNGDGFALHVEWTGTAAGDLQLWFTTRPFPDLADDDHWTQDANFGTSGDVALGGAAGKFGANGGNAKAKFWRFKVSGGSGTGNILAWVIAQRTA